MNDYRQPRGRVVRNAVMARISAAGLVFVAALLALAGCDNATTGRITLKSYEEPYTYWDTQCGMYMTSSNGVMSCTFYVTNPVNIAECGHLGFHNDQDGQVCLPQQKWDQYTEGSHYPDPK